MTLDDAPTLADLPIGSGGTVREVRCPRPVARRLMEMGVLPGTPVTVVRIAPLGDPIVLRLRGYSLSIRRQEAAGVVLTDVRERAAASSPATPAAERVPAPSQPGRQRRPLS